MEFGRETARMHESRDLLHSGLWYSACYNEFKSRSPPGQTFVEHLDCHDSFEHSELGAACPGASRQFLFCFSTGYMIF